jgi:ABC-type glutathione transport system ATPase component
MMDETQPEDFIPTRQALAADAESAPPERAAVTAAPKEILLVDRLRVSVAQSGRDILSGVSFSIREREIFAIAGESGSGKTTLGCSVTMLLPPLVYSIGGSAVFGGLDLLSAGEAARRSVLRKEIRYLFQEPGQALNPIARIGTQMRLAFDWRDGGGERFHDLLNSFGLGDHGALLRAYPHELSIGTLQRILLAAALAPRPALLIADEPTSAIDFELKHTMMEHLQLLCASNRMSVIFITHDLPLARTYADRLSILSDGRLLQAD